LKKAYYIERTKQGSTRSTGKLSIKSLYLNKIVHQNLDIRCYRQPNLWY